MVARMMIVEEEHLLAIRKAAEAAQQTLDSILHKGGSSVDCPAPSRQYLYVELCVPTKLNAIDSVRMCDDALVKDVES